MTARLTFSLVPLVLLAACDSRGPADDAEPAATELSTPALATEISPEALAKMRSGKADFALVDVRTPEEFAEGHIEGATNIDWKGSDFGAKVSSLPKDKDIVLYCRTGHRSGEAQRAMAEMGFQHVASMNGGIVAWQDGKMPVVE